MKRPFSKRSYIKVISFLSFVCVLLAAVAIVNGYRTEKYKIIAEYTSRSAVSELCENLDSITVNLQKSLYTNSETMLSHYGTELSRNASCAKVSLGSLTEENLFSEEIYKFLSQVGAYTLALDKKLQSQKELSAKEREGLQKLYDYAVSISENLGALRDGYYDNTISFEKLSSTLKSTSEELPELFSDKLNDAEQSFADYPTLLYDGPFADSLLKTKSAFLESKDEISEEKAKQIAAEILDCRENQLRRDSDEQSGIDLFCFSLGERAIAVTKKGGYLCYLTNPYYSSEAEISEKAAIKVAKDFLASLGYKNMKESYYSDYDGVCTVNFAYSEDGVVYYSDLIKVSIALDSAKAVAVDARGFLMNHTERSLPEVKVRLNKAKKNLSQSLTVLGTQTALIPTEDGKEKLCHELHCKDTSGQEVLVYTDVQTGQEDDIKILLYSDEGTLVK